METKKGPWASQPPDPGDFIIAVTQDLTALRSQTKTKTGWTNINHPII